MKIKEVRPMLALPGGLVQLDLEGMADPIGLKVRVGGVPAELQGASSSRVLFRVPTAPGGRVEVSNGGDAIAPLTVGRQIASELHPVANPAIDWEGNVYVTYSGTRGESVTFGVFSVTPEGEVEPFLADIANPTGLVIGPDGYLYISSRLNGEVYRTNRDKQIEEYADGLGLATGLAFDSSGNLFVGDRSGVIYKVAAGGQKSRFCGLEPSVSAFHLAIDSEDNLYATGPTLATQDAVYKISPNGRIEVLFRGLGRPQGVGFDAKGNLHVAASYRGRKGLYELTEGSPVLRVAGPMLVGFAYSGDGHKLYCVDNSTLFRVDLGH